MTYLPPASHSGSNTPVGVDTASAPLAKASKPVVTVPISPITSLGSYLNVYSTVLDLSSSNYATWSKEVLICLGLCGLTGYAAGEVDCPDPFVDPVSYANWHINNRAVLAFISRKCSLRERIFVRSLKPVSASSAWEALKVRHSRPNVLQQILLFREAMDIKFSRSTPLNEALNLIHHFVRRIFDLGKLDPNSSHLLVLVNALSGEMADVQQHIFIQMAVNPSYNWTDLTRYLTALDIERQVKGLSGTPKTPLVASSEKTSQPFCSKCRCQGHLATNCSGPGNPQGKRD